MYSITHDDSAGRITVILSGFWSEEMMERYQAELMATTQKLRQRHPVLTLLVDASDYPTQSKEVAERHRLLAAASPGQDKVAVVVASALTRIQATRARSTDMERTFGSMEEALAWLDE
ncbi:MAG: STAS/SEC14 domain-containing protein [Sphingobium sp.]